MIDNPKYYSTMTQAVQGTLSRIMRLSVKDGEITSLRQFAAEQEKFRADLERLLAPLDSGQARNVADNAIEQAAEGNYIPMAIEG